MRDNTSHKSSCYVPDAPGLPIRFLKNVCAHHITHLAHVILQVLPLRLEGQVADEDASAFNVIAVGVNLLDPLVAHATIG